MSVYRSMHRGSWIVERRVCGFSIRRATGCATRVDALMVEATLLRARKHGRRDLVEAFARRRISGPELVAAVERYGFTVQLTLEAATPLRRLAYQWLRTADLAPKTKTEYRYNLAILAGPLPPLNRPATAAERRQLERGPDVRELPILLRRYGRRCATKPVMFIQVKAAAQSLVRDTVPKGRQSDLWREVAGIQGPKRKRRQVQGGLTPERARDVAERLAAACGAAVGAMWWTLCVTGMGRREYWHYPHEPMTGRWQVLADRILVHGTKRESRDRTIPRLTTPVRPVIGDKRFSIHLARVAVLLGIPRLTPYVARRTFAHFLELAQREGGILASRCDLYMGHSPKSDREKYREHDVGPYLAADAAALRAVIGGEPQYLEVMA